MTDPAGLAGTDRPLAEVHDVALLDLDGVVYVGPHALAHAPESLAAAADEHGMRLAFVTNNAARPPAVVAEHLRSLGIRARDEDVVTSAQAGARVARELLPEGSPVLAVGGPGVALALQQRGLVPVTSADDRPLAVVQGYGPDVGWSDLAEACLAIEAGAVWIATNLDRTIPIARGRVLGNGALVAAIRHAMDVEPVVAGKPLPPLMLESVERTAGDRPLVVGDRLDTDIEGANGSGLPSLLVLTGVTDWHQLLLAPPEQRPTYLGLDLRALLEPAPEVRVDVGADWVWAGSAEATIQVAVTAGPGADPRGTAWLPEALRDLDVPTTADLDRVRAAVSAAWAMADRGLIAVGPATVVARD